eukprot:TRINITY_DN12065_c0_g1_i1.p1 TRINITY_DN12065_c0_g1~~TRINITY_DN12065_c0_g1_i1.p1  ORF type:complete len:793 (+),score=200.62 TRINITY_DN12065_c0_g1_i1:93-2381(+)
MADILANSSILPGCAASIRVQAEPLREKTAQLIGLILRQATVIFPQVPLPAVLTALAEAVRDLGKDVKLKRRLVGALGEALFFVVTQISSDQAASEGKSWKLPSLALSTILRCLNDDEDPAVQLYAARTVENLSTVEQGPHLKALLANDVIVRLFHVLDLAKGASLRRSASAGVFHLAAMDAGLAQHLVDKLSAPIVAKLLQDSSARVRQGVLSTLVMLFASPQDSNRAQMAVTDSKQCLQLILKTARLGPSLNRAKAYLVFAGMIKRSDVALQRLCQGRLLLDLERDNDLELLPEGEEDAAEQVYLAQCAALLVRMLVQQTEVLLSRLSTAIVAIKDRKHPSATQAKALKDAQPAMVVVPLLLASRVVLPLLDLQGVIPDVLALLQVSHRLATGETTVDNTDLDGDALITLPTSLLELLLAHPNVDETLFAGGSRWMMDAWVRLAGFTHIADNLHPIPALQLLVALLHRAQAEQVWADMDHHHQQSTLASLLPALAAGLSGTHPVPAVAARCILVLASMAPDVASLYQQHGIATACYSAFQPQVSAVKLSGRRGLMPAERAAREDAALMGAPDSVPLSTLTAAVMMAPGQDLGQACNAQQLHWRVAAALVAIDKHGVVDVAQCGAVLSMVYTLLKLAASLSKQALQASDTKALVTQAERLLDQLSVLAQHAQLVLNMCCHESHQVASQAAKTLGLLLQLYSNHYPMLTRSDALRTLTTAMETGDSSVQRHLSKIVQRAVKYKESLKGRFDEIQVLASALSA